MEDEAFEFDKPRFLLPEGCKDLNDVIRLQEQAASIQGQRNAISAALEEYAIKFSPGLPSSITIPDTVRVDDLADMLRVKPYELIAILLMFDIFASSKSEISFAIASKACAILRVEVKKAESA